MISPRRKLMKSMLAGAAALSIRSLATGLPASFLLTGHMPAFAAGIPKNLILAMSDDGESLNCNGPGFYSSNTGDPRFGIDRLPEFSNPVTIRMGDYRTQAAPMFGKLSQDLLDRMSIFHIQTHANGHPDGPRVHAMNGALKNSIGRGQEEIQSAIVQELISGGINTDNKVDKPILISTRKGRLASLSIEGVPISRYSPQGLKDLYLGKTAGFNINEIKRIYDVAIDQTYKRIKTTGTAAQRKYLDAHALTRAQAANLGEGLGTLLTNITGDTDFDQMRAAVAMAKVNLSPVIVVRYAYSRDNHGSMEEERDLSLSAVENLEGLWMLLKEQKLTDTVNFATYDIFGRTTRVNDGGGRDHHNSSCANMMIGANIKPGFIGGFDHHTRGRKKDDIKATGINSKTGKPEDADIPAGETLTAYGRTLMASMGISEERINVRIPSGKTIRSAMTI